MARQGSEIPFRSDWVTHRLFDVMLCQVLIVGLFPEQLSDLKVRPRLEDRVFRDGRQREDGLEAVEGALHVAGSRREERVRQGQEGRITKH